MNKRQVNFFLGLLFGVGVAIAWVASVLPVFWAGVFLSLISALGYIAQD